MIRLSNDKDEYLIMICRNDNSDEDPITMIMMKRVTIVIMIMIKMITMMIQINMISMMIMIMIIMITMMIRRKQASG